MNGCVCVCHCVCVCVCMGGKERTPWHRRRDGWSARPAKEAPAIHVCMCVCMYACRDGWSARPAK